MSLGASKRDAYVMIAPLAAVVLAFVAFPTVYSYYMSLFGVRLSSDQRSFAGLSNYVNIITDESFRHSVVYSARFALLATMAELVAGIALAVLLNRKFKGKGLVTSLSCCP